MEEEISRDLIGDRLYDLVIDFWEETCDNMDRVQEKTTFKPALARIDVLVSMMSNN